MNIQEYNNEYLNKLSKFLNNNSKLISRQLVERTMKEGLTEEESVQALLSSFLELDQEEEYYLKKGLKQLNVEDYQNNMYYQNINIDIVEKNNISYEIEEYDEYEIFVRDDFIKEGERIIPQLGYFNKKFKYPCIKENNNIWMLITPNEINTMKAPINNATGKVLTFGLGLGYFPYMVSNKKEVSEITIIENNQTVIDLFNKNILPQFPNKDKIKIIKADAYEYGKKIEGYDYVFVDIYHDVSDGIDTYIYFKLRENKKIKYDYWIEKTIKCYF